MITQQRLHELFELDQGNLVWINKDVNYKRKNKYAGNLDANTGRTRVYVDGKLHYLHRLVFLYVNGYMPKVVDHIDGDTSNNAPSNLRAASVQTNNYNRRLESTSTSGVKGVCWHSRDKKWRVQIGVNGKRKTIGQFDDLELAELVAIEAREKYHGKFARHS